MEIQLSSRITSIFHKMTVPESLPVTRPRFLCSCRYHHPRVVQFLCHRQAHVFPCARHMTHKSSQMNCCGDHSSLTCSSSAFATGTSRRRRAQLIPFSDGSGLTSILTSVLASAGFSSLSLLSPTNTVLQSSTRRLSLSRAFTSSSCTKMTTCISTRKIPHFDLGPDNRHQRSNPNESS